MVLLSGQKGRDAMGTDSTSIGGGGGSLTEYRHPLLWLISGYLGALDARGDATAKRSVRWTMRAAAMAAVVMAWADGRTMSVRCGWALGCMGVDWVRGRAVGKTYNGLMKALVRQSSVALPALRSSLRERVRGALGGCVKRVEGWTALAVDGSKQELARTASVEASFGVSDNGACPQALMTSVVEVTTGLAWDWRIDAGRGDEKGRLIEMAAALPADALLLADGNFVGYPVWSALSAAGHRFLIRVGGNVSLLRRLWPGSHVERHDDIVYAWPNARRRHAAPLCLRLIELDGDGGPVCLLTNVLDRRRLTHAAASKLYRLRWGVELYYRTFKRTVGCAKLRSRSGDRARVELEWAMIAHLIATLIGVQHLRQRRLDPARLSPAKLIDALRDTLRRDPRLGSPHAARRRLIARLGRATRDTYTRHRDKRSRHRPITHNTPKPLRLKPPRIRDATETERRLAQTHHPIAA